MKLISLNTWGGRLHEQIDEFIKGYASTTDIFCFQEVYANGTKEADADTGERPNFFKELQDMLPSFTGVFAEQVTGTGLATFVRDSLEIESSDSFLLLSCEELNHLQMSNGIHYYPRIVQMVCLKNPHIAIYNFHGVPGNDKKDTTERELQLKRLQEALAKSDGEKVLVGDFNLRPDTDAIRSLEGNMKNLVIEGGFKTTRTKYYDKKVTMPFADYTFVTYGIKVNRFEVLPDEASDHLPMFLDVENKLLEYSGN